MKTSELTGAALDWAVAKCEGYSQECLDDIAITGQQYESGFYSSDWTQGGPIIEREMIELVPQSPALWEAMYRNQHIPHDGPTPLIAAMRCYVASKLGDTVDIPKELPC
jgi:hypothetical protein